MAAQLVASYDFTETVGNSEVTREAIGVVACITPWNYPLTLVAAKVAPALAAGCTVVLKPSEVAPLTAWLLAEVIHDVGLPAGVFNLVPGFGPVVGEALASHPEVDMVSFTGSTAAGRRVGELGARTIKRVALELGGKSAAIVLDDADFTSAVSGAIQACYLNNGQTCFAHTRMLVPLARMDEVKQIAAQVVGNMKVGNPLDEQNHIGPVISAVQQKRVQDYIRKGIEEGAELVTGGAEAPAGQSRGYFVQPTVFANVTSQMTIAREEIFGPVLSILGYQDEDDAVRIANDSIYGLGGAVWSGDVARGKARCASLAHRSGRYQRCAVQSDGAVRRLQAVRQRTRVRSLRTRRIPRVQIAANAGRLTPERHRSSSKETDHVWINDGPTTADLVAARACGASVFGNGNRVA